MYNKYNLHFREIRVSAQAGGHIMKSLVEATKLSNDCQTDVLLEFNQDGYLIEYDKVKQFLNSLLSSCQKQLFKD